MLDDVLPETRLSEVSKHLEQCGNCISRLERMTAESPFAWAFPDTTAAAADRSVRVEESESAPLHAERTVQGFPQRIVIEGFELREEIGRGGHGVVFRAVQRSLGRPVALKVLKRGGLASQDETRRFTFEAMAAARLKHPGIVDIYEFGSTGLDEIDGQPWFAMELLEGGTLAQRFAGIPVEPRKGAKLLACLANAVAAAHAAGVIHRDLKPGNILFAKGRERSCEAGLKSPWEEGEVVKIADFGLSKQLDAVDGPTPSVAIVGTPAYMAPEQAIGDAKGATPQVDIYGLGAILYELLTGRPPFQAATPFETLLRVREGDPQPVRATQPWVPRDLEVICLTCLEKEPHRRYATALALADDLQRFVDGKPIVARPPGAMERGLRWCRRHKFAGAVAGFAAMALVAVVTSMTLTATARSERIRTREAAVQSVMQARPRDLAETVRALRGEEQSVVEALLHAEFSRQKDPQDMVRAVCVLERPSVRELEFLVKSLAIVDHDECPHVVNCLARAKLRSDIDVVALLKGELEASAVTARWLLTLCFLGDETPVHAILMQVGDPAPRTAMIDELARWWPGAQTVTEVLAKTPSGEIRSALCCGIAQMPREQLVPIEIDLLCLELDRQFRTADDAATHSSAGLALRRWRGSTPQLLASDGPEPGRAWYVDRFGQTMVMLDSGQFTMGMAPGSFGHSIQTASFAHPVTVPGGIYISATEVTRGLFEQFVNHPRTGGMDGFEEENWRQRWNIDNTRISETPNHPIQNVHWQEALIFCDWLTRLDGRSSCYHRFDRAAPIPAQRGHYGELRGYWFDHNADGYRLPTEEEWEYACRAGALTDYFYGDQIDGDNAKIRPEYSHIGSRKSLAVGSLLPNRFGLFDMHGNVCEWCWNGDRIYTTDAYVASVPQVSGLTVAHRGGSWMLSARWAIAGYRGQTGWNHSRDVNMGFRVVCPPRRTAAPPTEADRPECGFIFHDFNGNGIYEPRVDDVPLQGISLFVDRNGDGQLQAEEPTAISDERGEFSFSGLLPGRYDVCCRSIPPWIVVEADSQHATASLPNLLSADVSPGLTQSSVMELLDDGRCRMPWFRAYTGQFLEGDVFVDANRNGQRDPDETGVAGAQITVRSPNDDRAEFTTQEDGQFRIWRLPGPQRIRVDLPEGVRWWSREHKRMATVVYSQAHPRIPFAVRAVNIDPAVESLDLQNDDE
ncbi:MAG: protein kinase domain-containing protein [Planctomycetales bacterium]